MTIKLLNLNSNQSELRERFDCLTKLPWISASETPDDQPFLLFDHNHLAIADVDWPKIKPVSVDFLSNAASHRRLHGGGAGQAVAKAIGLNKNRSLRVLDATAGLGRDSFVMASLGAQVLMYERHPVVFQLLNDGLMRFKANRSEELADLSLRLEQGIFFDSSEAEAFAPQVIYLDPMFPSREKSAKVKKDMALFHDLVGIDADADKLLEPAIALAEFRVVVKRPKQAPYLAGKVPTTSLVGKSSRFDLYTKKSIVS
ncbi:class I SAM-dependent methyltransferase [Reinekea sp.]|jgi:16S rRNA (guanine1516-N2)-methyltransferase|uniref:class I SAM-dependent methyltransferase n=1 Tax=Reinekea sp. TaxID=1970455 RepID=UPI003988FA8D